MVNLTSARKHIERLYVDACSIVDHGEVFDPDTGITSFQEVIVCENEPCKLSFKTGNLQSASPGVGAALSQQIKLIIRPDLTIKPGAKINVTRNGVTTAYKRTGQPAMHINHQELTLELWENYA